MISFNHVTKKYGKNLIFDDISFKFEDTGAYCITGENGAGKTTLLQLIAKLIKPTKGLIINENKTIYVNNENNVFLDLSLIDNFRLVNSNEDKINDVLENTKLKDLKDKKTSTLSYGERLRVAIGMALLGDYEILLFDEPTSNLDSDNASIIINLLLSYSNDKLIIITSNDKKEISCFNNILEIKERKILCSFNCALQDSYVLNTKSSKLIKSLFPYFYIIMTIFIALIINFYTIISVKNNDIIKGITEDRNVLVCEENDEFGLLNISDGKLLFSNNYTETKRLDFNFFSFNQSDELLESLNRDYSTTAINILDYSDYIFYNPIYVYAHLDDKLLNDEVIVTDYLYDSFIYFKLIENDNLKIGNLSYKIADIIKTNYSIEKEKFDILAQNFEQKSIKLDELSIAMLNKYTYSLSSSTRYSLVPIYTVKEQNIFRYMYSNIYFKDENEIIKAFTKATSYSEDGMVCVEEFIAHNSLKVVEADIFLVNDDILWDGLCYCYRFPEAPLRPVLATYPVVLDSNMKKEFESTVRKVLKEANARLGEFNIEGFFTDEGRFFIIEINPRPAGDYCQQDIKAYCGVDYTKLMVTTAINDMSYYEELKNYKRMNNYILSYAVFSFFSGVFSYVYIDPSIRDCLIEFREFPGGEKGAYIEDIHADNRPVGIAVFAFSTKEELKYARDNIRSLVYVVLE